MRLNFLQGNSIFAALGKHHQYFLALESLHSCTITPYPCSVNIPPKLEFGEIILLSVTGTLSGVSGHLFPSSQESLHSTQRKNPDKFCIIESRLGGFC